MASHTSRTAAAASSAGALAPSALQADGALVVQDFSAWPEANQLGEYTGAGEFATDADTPEVEDGALRLEYDDAGWFLTNVRADVSDYVALEIDVRGDDGGEESDVQLEVGAVEGTLGDLAEGSIDTEFSTLTVDLADAGVDRSSLDDVWLNFWRAGSGAVEIDELRFVPEGGDGPCADLETLDVDGQTVCNVDGDGYFRDVNGDGNVGNRDVGAFFENFHLDAFDRDEFDYSGNGRVSHGDVVALFDYVI